MLLIINALLIIARSINKTLKLKQQEIIFVYLIFIVYFSSWAINKSINNIYALKLNTIFNINLIMITLCIFLSYFGIFKAINYTQKFKKTFYDINENFYSICIIIVAIIALVLSIITNISNDNLFFKFGFAVSIILYFVLSILLLKILNKIKYKVIPIILTILSILIIAFVYLFPIEKLKGKKHINSDRQYFNLIIITVDALRYDYLSIYNDSFNKTPELHKFAQEAMVFNNAYTPSPWTIPSLSALLTSKYPSAIGQISGKGSQIIPTQIKTLPEMLNNIGFNTYIFMHPYIIERCKGIIRGFDYVIPVPYITTYRMLLNELLLTKIWILPKPFYLQPYQAKYINKQVFCLHNKIKEPFFIWIHYFDTHLPYSSPEINIKDKSILKIANINPLDIRAGTIHLSNKDKEQLKQLYAKEINYVDKNIGSLFKYLKANNLYDSTMIIFTADHGEEFWEHNNFTHGHSMYEEVIHIPLIIKFPKNINKVSKSNINVSLIDISPTILNILNVKNPYNYSGFNLLNIIDNPEEYQTRAVFAENTCFYNEKKAVIQNGYKLIIDDVKSELYNLINDPKENYPLINESIKNNLIPIFLRWQEENNVFRNMHSIIASQGKESSKELKLILKSLGYAR